MWNFDDAFTCFTLCLIHRAFNGLNLLFVLILVSVGVSMRQNALRILEN
jgi:hypothetical protein